MSKTHDRVAHKYNVKLCHNNDRKVMQSVITRDKKSSITIYLLFFVTYRESILLHAVCTQVQVLRSHVLSN
jgi:hypothetical protein